MNWWETPFRMVQTNLREIDVNLDPKKLIRDVKDFNANVVLINVGGIVAFYPTQLEMHHRNDYMQSDMVAAVLEEAHKNDVRVVARFDFSKCHAEVYQNHPEWFTVGLDGAPVVYNGLYSTCINGGYYREYCLKILEEAFGRYELDGAFFNMFGYQVYDYSGNYHGICQCDNCRSRFEEMFHAPLPTVEDWDDPIYRDYIEFKRITAEEVAKAVYQTIKRVRPSVGVMLRSDHSDIIRLEVNRALDRPLPEWSFWAGEQAKWSASFGDGKPYSSSTVHFVDIPYRFVSESEGCMGLRMAQQIAGGSSLDFYVVGTLEQDDKKDYEICKQLFGYYERNTENYVGMRSTARVALVDSELTSQFYGRRDSTRYTHHFRGMYRILVENHIPFDVIADHRLNDPDAEQILAKYDAIILPNVACLNATQRQILDRYVANGGGLLASFETSLFDDKGRCGQRFSLESLGAKKVLFRRSDTRGAYFVDTQGIPGFEQTKRVILDGDYLYTEYDGEAVLALDPPQRYGPPEKCYQYEGVKTNLPGLVFNHFGKGKTAYFPWEVDRLYYRHSLEECAKLVVYALSRVRRQQERIEVKAPTQIEVSVAENAKRDVLVHLVNFSGFSGTAYFEPIRIHDIEVRLDCDREVESATLLMAGKEIPIERTKTGVKFIVPYVDYLEAIKLVTR